MSTTVIKGIDIEDYYGNAVENIEFDKEIDIDLNEITVRIMNFSFADTYIEDDYNIARIQYDLEKGIGNTEEMHEIHSELMEILLEKVDGELENESEVSDQILNALEILI